MSSNPDKHRVNMVRISQSDTNDISTYKNNVTIRTLWDGPRELMYLCIENNGKRIFTQDFKQLYWLPESSTNGVATIRSLNTIVVIIYDDQNVSLVNFFLQLQKSLTELRRTSSSDPASSEPDSDQLKCMIDQLTQSISSGDSNKAECIAQQLAELCVNIQFNLNNKTDNEEKSILKSISNTGIQGSSDSILQLKVCIECLSQKDPIIAPIEVLFGTTLHSLKTQIEKETGIKSTDQYWFAFKQYLIPDDYIFGSLVSFIPNGNQRILLGNSIRSGDTLIMYIAQTSSIH